MTFCVRKSLGVEVHGIKEGRDSRTCPKFNNKWQGMRQLMTGVDSYSTTEIVLTEIEVG